MRRRKFIALSVGAAVSWPLAARAQQPTGMRRVAFLLPWLEADTEAMSRVTAFREGLEALGWTENRNIRIEHRYAGGDLGRTRAYARELVHSAPDLIVGNGAPITAALKEATSTIPIVFSLVTDPVGQGLVASLSRPGGNITGFSALDFPLIGKWLELLKEIAPGVRHVALLFDPDTTPFYPAFLHELGAANKSLAVELSASPVHDEAEVEAAITALAREPGGGLIAAPDVFLNSHRQAIMTLTERHRLPAIYGFRQFVREGALISYGPDFADLVRRSAGYVDCILKGERPADLPVQAPTKFELVINLKTAKAIGLEVPTHLQQLADEVIE
jgi:putative ABC transport system substrate-binding protein